SETAEEAAERSAARPLYGDTGLTTATPDEDALRATPQEEPAAAANPFETAPETRRAEPEPEAQPAAAEDPQEQPFERDGRWWFRRGDELLVYEEQTGQWVAAGEPSKSGSVAAPAGAGGQSTSPGEAGGGAAAGQVTTQLEPAGSFWKCPSCGAVNGSTATTCRMCFTARP
ncbi:MAG: zinc finger Ran-binding domain-containing protein, partial [Actinomycetota bacterium]|nr:zinc finger Ran-binding domain-containing protein [Actinomycetota bacterium]